MLGNLSPPDAAAWRTFSISPRLWTGLVTLLAVLFVAETFWCLFPIPYWDAIDWILSYLRDGAGAVFGPDNEHRLPIPRLLFGLDIDLFGGLLWPVSAIALLALFALAALVGRATFAVLKHSESAAIASGCALAVSVLLRGYTLPDYVTATNVQFPIGLALAALAFATLVSRCGWLTVGLAAALAVAASGCGSGNLVVLPILAWLVWRVHGDVAAALVLCAISVIIPILYVRGLSIQAPAALAWGRLPLFVLEYFGAPWTRLPSTVPVAWVQGGVIVVTLAGFLLWNAVRGPIAPSGAFLLALAATALAMGLLTGIGRASTVDLQTQGSRYGVYAATAQAVFVALSWPWVWRRVRNWRGGLRTAAFVLVAGLLVAEQVLSGVAVHSRTVGVAAAARKLCRGFTASGDLAIIYPLPARALDFMHEIESRKLYCFRRAAA